MSESAINFEDLGGKAGAKTLKSVYGESQGLARERCLSLARSLSADSSSGMASDSRKGTKADAPLRFYSAPGRIELGGNHTDHNRGKVLCAAVAVDALACVAASEGKLVRIVSEGFPGPIVVDLASLDPMPEERGRTEALIRGVARGFSDRGFAPRGFSAHVHSTVLPGSGLSSSAAVEVLLGTIMSDLTGAGLEAVEIAKIGQRAENDFFGKPCGLMDQTASAVGAIAAIDFADPSMPKVQRIEYDFEAEGYSILVVDTGGSHADLTSDYAAIPAEMRKVAAFLGATELRDIDPALFIARGPEIRAACGDRAFLRALHFAGEEIRVENMVEALREGKLGRFLKLVKKSGDSSWRLLQNLYPSSKPEEQGLCVALALSSEYLGKRGAWRVQGGGFAGTIQAYLPHKLVDGYTALMERFFGKDCVMRVSVRSRGACRLF